MKELPTPSKQDELLSLLRSMLSSKPGLEDTHHSAPVNLRVNPEYKYELDNIRLISKARVKELEHWLLHTQTVKKLRPEQFKPIILPEGEISFDAKSGSMGSLLGYLLFEKKDTPKEMRKRAKSQADDDEADEQTSDSASPASTVEKPQDLSRIIFIPFNTVDHWVTIVLSIGSKNNLTGVAYIDSLGSPADLQKAAYKGPLPEPSNKRFLPVTEEIVRQIREAYPEFKEKPVREFKHYIQSDKTACGPLAIENAIALIKMYYLGGINFSLQPTWCDKHKSEEIRGKHLQCIGGTQNDFYEKQLKNETKVESPIKQDGMLLGVSSIEHLEADGRDILNWIGQLEETYRKMLLEALQPKMLDDNDSEEITDHLGRIHEVLKKIYKEIREAEEKAEKEEAKREEEELQLALKLSLENDADSQPLPKEEIKDIADSIDDVSGLKDGLSGNQEAVLPLQDEQGEVQKIAAQKILFESILKVFYGSRVESFEDDFVFKPPFIGPLGPLRPMRIIKRVPTKEFSYEQIVWTKEFSYEQILRLGEELQQKSRPLPPIPSALSPYARDASGISCWDPNFFTPASSLIPLLSSSSRRKGSRKGSRKGTRGFPDLSDGEEFDGNALLLASQKLEERDRADYKEIPDPVPPPDDEDQTDSDDSGPIFASFSAG